MAKVVFKTKRWRDKATKAWIVYSKEYDISGYGKTVRQAEEMFEFIIKDIVKAVTRIKKE